MKLKAEAEERRKKWEAQCRESERRETENRREEEEKKRMEELDEQLDD